MNINELSVVLEFAQYSKDFMDAKERERDAKSAYIEKRNEFLVKEYGYRHVDKPSWLEATNHPGFQEATRALYIAYMDAKYERSKAYKRLVTRYKKLPHESLEQKAKTEKKSHLRLVGGDK